MLDQNLAELLLPIYVKWYESEAKSKMAHAGRAGNSDLTFKTLSRRFDACQRRVKEQLQSLCQVIKNLGLNNNKDCDDGKINRFDGLT